MDIKSTIIVNKKKYNSYFDNTVKNTILHHIKGILLGVITLGFAYPWILCINQEARCKHTVVCGKRLKFIGDPKELIRHWILWWLLIILTLGLYGLAVKVRFSQWVAANTIFDDTEII
ncbi:MAG: hypothetical protein ACRDA3_05450 [Peptostreptococcaceae bacterium]